MSKEIKEMEECPFCQGSGVEDCNYCHGEGNTKTYYDKRDCTCMNCEGTGKIPCSACHGEGYVEKDFYKMK